MRSPSSRRSIKDRRAWQHCARYAGAYVECGASARLPRPWKPWQLPKCGAPEQQTLASRPYAEKSLQVLSSLARQVGGASGLLHPLLTRREVRRIGIVLITADRGMAGSFNTNMIRKAVEFTKVQTVPVGFITVGRKGRDFLLRYGFSVQAEFTGIPDRPSLADVLPVARVAIDDFAAPGTKFTWHIPALFIPWCSGQNWFVCCPWSLSGKLARLLPWTIFTSPMRNRSWTGSATLYRNAVLPRQYWNRSPASRAPAWWRCAMRASRPTRTQGSLTLSYNKARQESITKELLDIAGGAEALAQALRGANL